MARSTQGHKILKNKILPKKWPPPESRLTVNVHSAIEPQGAEMKADASNGGKGPLTFDDN